MSSGCVIATCEYVIEKQTYVIECRIMGQMHICRQDGCVIVTSAYVIENHVYIIEFRFMGQTHMCHQDMSL